MQTILDPTVISSLTTAFLSFCLSIYLFFLWKKQANRLYTDLPLMFGIIFISSAVSQVLQALPLLGVFGDSVEMFRIRAFVVLVMVVPMVVVLLNILAPRLRRHHNKITAASAVYWIAATFLGTSREQIMTMVMPLLLVLMIGWLVMFTITWKTGRLKEVRSDLMVFATILSLISQGSKIALMGMGIGFVADIITAISVITYTVAMVNPWYKREQTSVDSVEVAAAIH
ncbi:MAG: hypothetical protein ACW974_08105 [Candidatus Thorarchaeota archaeon]